MKIKKIVIILFISILISLISFIILLNKKVSINNLYSSLVYIESEFNDKKIKGSGVVYNIKNNVSYILTNYHVIGKSDDILVYDSTGNYNSAKIVDYNELYDIAIIKVSNLKLKKAKFGNSDKLKVLDDIYVLGNPLGKQYFGTFTKGIVSNPKREIKVQNINMESKYVAIQIDASINSGNSGGMLLNKNREVVGLVTIKENDLDGVGFAIPINFVKEVIGIMNY